MNHLAFALSFMAGIAAGVYLVVHDHPFFGVVVFLITAGIKINSSSNDTEKKDG